MSCFLVDRKVEENEAVRMSWGGGGGRAEVGRYRGWEGGKLGGWVGGLTMYTMISRETLLQG